MNGYVRGEAVLIRTHDDIQDLKTRSQVPDAPKLIAIVWALKSWMVPHLLGTVSAMVSDQGGIYTHAAIVSREFNIPCVVGTKIATQTIKTGDKILLDAMNETGAVKKIIKPEGVI